MVCKILIGFLKIVFLIVLMNVQGYSRAVDNFMIQSTHNLKKRRQCVLY